MVEAQVPPAVRRLLTELFVDWLEGRRSSRVELAVRLGVDEEYVGGLSERAQQRGLVQSLPHGYELTEAGRKAITIVFQSPPS